MTESPTLGDGRPPSEERLDDSGTPARAGEDAPAPPKLDGLPVLGNTLSLLGQGLALGDRLQERGDVVAYDALGRRFVAVFDPALVESVLVTRNDAFRKGDFETEFASTLAPQGLATVEGEAWRRQRQLLQPAFTPTRLRGFADAMVADAADLAEGWTDGEVVSLRPALSSYSLSVLAGTLLDVDVDAERGAVVRDAVDAIADLTTGVWALAPDWLPTPADRRYRRAMDALDDLVATLVAERRGDADDHDDLLATMLAATYPDGSRMDESVVRDQLVTFLFAGHETTATALTYACWLLAAHPDVRADLDAELDAVLGDRDPTFEDLSALEQTDRVVRETLRLYPPVYSLYRQPVADTTLGGYAVPADATVQLGTYHVQRDPRWWDAPDEFRPGRWAESAPDRPEYAYLPFGGGPRHCIGMRFATMELKLALATLCRRVRFERAGEVSPTPRVVLDPGEVPMRVRER